MTKYKTYVSDAYYVNVKDDDGSRLEWANEVDTNIPEFTSKHVETHKTLKEALDSMNEWGSKWEMYPSVYVENEEREEVYSSYPALYKCNCCKREDWERIESDVREFKKKDGSIMFPDIV